MPRVCRTAAVVAVALLSDMAAARPSATVPPVASPDNVATVLIANNETLGTVTVRLEPTAGAAAVTDNERTRAAVLSGLAVATDWLSVDDTTRFAVNGDEACGSEGKSVTYVVDLAPAVLPTAAQARQLNSSSAATSINNMFKSNDVEPNAMDIGSVGSRVTKVTVNLDASLFRTTRAPFPAGARAGQENVLLGWFRVTGKGVNLCPPGVGLAALRTLRRNDLVALRTSMEAAFANRTASDHSLPQPTRKHNVANTRFVRVVPRDESITTPGGVSLATAALDGGRLPDVVDFGVAVAGLTKGQAESDYAAAHTGSRLQLFARELALTPGVRDVSVGSVQNSWLYNDRNIESRTMSPVSLTAAILVPMLVVAVLAAAGIAAYLRRRKRRRDRDATLAALANNALSATTDSGKFDKASDLLKAMTAAAPAATPLARLAAVDWEVDPADLEVCTDDDGAEIELGNGASGRVIKGKYRVTSQLVAIKILKQDTAVKAGDAERELESLAKEILMLRAARHPNIVSFVGASIQDGAPPILVVELMQRGDLYRALDNPRYAPVFKWVRARAADGKPRPYSGMNRRVALDVARGLAYLHSKGVVHLDVKSLNVLLANDLTAKLADCGAARALGDAARATLTSPAGTLAWMAPEVMMGDAATPAADVYSYGVLLWELSTGERPKRGLRQLNDDEAPATVRRMVDACLSSDPAARPSMADVIAVLESIDDDGEHVSPVTTSGSEPRTVGHLSWGKSV